MEEPTAKTCSKCGETKPAADYLKGRRPCKACRVAYGKQWRRANPDRVRAHVRKSLPDRKRGPQHYSSDYYARNAEHIRDKNRRYREQRLTRTPEEVAADRQRLRTDGLKVCGKCKLSLPLARFFNNLHTADGLQARCRTCHAGLSANGRLTRRALGWWAANGMDPSVCTYCSATLNYRGSNPHAPTMQVDHIVPVARGGGDESENLAPACPDCNRSKHAQPLAAWLTGR